jgi:hypothetical protein
MPFVGQATGVGCGGEHPPASSRSQGRRSTDRWTLLLSSVRDGAGAPRRAAEVDFRHVLGDARSPVTGTGGSMRRCRSLLIAVAVTAVVTTPISLGGPAFAALNDGAQVSDLDFCEPQGVFTFCAQQHNVTNVTQTPSGNTSVSGSNKTHFSITSSDPAAGCNDTGDSSGSFHFLLRAGQPDDQEDNSIGRQTETLDCSGVTFVCILDVHIHIVDGRAQFVRVASFCEQQ